MYHYQTPKVRSLHDCFSDEMRSFNLAFPSLHLISFLKLFIFSLHLKKSPPSPHLRFLTTIPSRLSNLPPNSIRSPRLLRTPENNSSSFYNQSDSSSSTLHSGLNREAGQDAHNLLDEIPQPNSWNVLQLSSALRTFSQTSQFYSTVRTFNTMRSTGINPDHFAYVSVILAGTTVQNLNFSDQILSLTLKVGLLSNGYVLSSLVDMLSKEGCFGEALDVFSYNYSDNVVCWNAIIAGAVRNGESLIALELFHQMVEGFCFPNGFTFSSALTACAAAVQPDVGRAMHAWVVKFNEQHDIFVGTAVVDLYAKCGDMDAAVKMFWSMPVRNVVSWTALISGFVQEDGASALKYFKQMMRNAIDVNKYTITSVLLACAKCCMEKISYQIHGWVLKSGLYTDPVVKDALISTYGRLGNVQMFDKVFKEEGIGVHLRNWSAMISSLVQNQCLGKSIELFLQMLCEGLQPDNACISSILSIVDCMSFGEQLHSHVIKTGLLDDVLVCSSLLTVYSKCGTIGESYELFSQMPDKDRVAWTSIISGFSSHGNAKEALHLFREMISEGIDPDETTFSSALKACNNQAFLEKGKEIHGFVLRRHGLIGSCLVSMYSKCNSIESARRVFAQIPCKDQISWSSLISSYSTNNYSEEAIFEFYGMATSGLEIDHITCSSVLVACAHLCKPVLGRQLHARSIKAGLILHNSVAAALVTLYSKCGNISESSKLFDGIQNPDLVTWTAMIKGYAQHGRAKEALEIFEVMKKIGIRPDSLTFVSILSACSHNGLVDEGFLHFSSMNSDYGIEPEMHHYACMVDLLGRAGRLNEAMDLIYRMPIEPSLLVWSTLLAACRVYGDAEIGNIARKKVLILEPHDSGTHIAASNLYADMGDWERVVQVRSSIKGFGMKKEPGRSAL